MVNPRWLRWTNPTERTDGSAYTAADNAGYELSFDGQPVVSIPIAWATEIELPTIEAYRDLRTGEHIAALRVVTKGGVRSDFSAPVAFQIEVAPLAPTNLVVD